MRGQGSVERGRTDPQQAHLSWLTLQQKKHMDNDPLISGLNIEP